MFGFLKSMFGLLILPKGLLGRPDLAGAGAEAEGGGGALPE